ncbi:TPA: hypothetical protein R0D49_005295 [Bacillus cereus]|nr:hypothetical protein CN892_27515 [Bacillus anthracis]HEB4955583.1 hypothetical protein [Bacillus cereus]
MTEKLVFKWYCNHCDAYNRTIINHKEEIKQYDMCKKCEEIHLVHSVEGDLQAKIVETAQC